MYSFKKWRQISFYYSYSYISFHLCLFNFRLLSVSMWSVSISYWYAKLGRICKTRRKQSNNNYRKCIFFTSLRNNKLSLWQIIYTQRFINDFAFKWCQIAREWLDILEVIGCWTWNLQYFWWNFKFYNRKHQIHPILFSHQSLYAMPNHLLIMCQNLIIWKHLLSEQLEFWKTRSLKNGYAQHGRMIYRTRSNNLIWNYRTRSKLMLNWINIMTIS